jgi:hypothetical protein
MGKPETVQDHGSILLAGFSRSSLVPAFACNLPFVMLFIKNQILFDSRQEWETILHVSS